MNEEKVRSFVEHIMLECERERLTLEEAMRVPQELRFALERQVKGVHERTAFTYSQTAGDLARLKKLLNSAPGGGSSEDGIFIHLKRRGDFRLTR